ncbi:MAG: MMPL family transporter, partial [Chromatiales bacterium]|nr:MMPL family transporter [Chromatiales bacterium]
SELGIISGVGMFISLIASLTALPAALLLLGGNGGALPGLGKEHGRLPRRLVLGGAVVAALAGAATLPLARFDHNPMHLRDAKTESVSTYLQLMDSASSAPWSLSVLGDRATLASLASRLATLGEVHETRSLADFVPTGQEDKLEAVADLDFLLARTLAKPGDSGASSPSDLKEAFTQLVEALRNYHAVQPEIETSKVRLVAAAEHFLKRLEADQNGALSADLHERVFAYFPATIARLATSLEAQPISLESLPKSLTDRWITTDGRWRLEIIPSADLDDNDALKAFVTQVQNIAPTATGTPEVNLGASRVVVGSFVQAFASAFVLIFGLLWLITGQLKDVILVLAPLLLAALLTASVMVLLGISFNFANVIALPLLLGIGVDNGIHLVHRARSTPSSAGGLLGTSTARGIVLSALTTICGFGSLAYSAHPGTSSMGLVLTIGLALTLTITLFVLPALLEPSDESK